MGQQDRVDLVLRLAGEIVHRVAATDCHFVLLGDGECLDEVRQMTADLGLEPWVQFPGWVTEEEVFRHLASADLGVDTSLQQEVSPVKAMEYMAFGLPFAAFDLPETRPSRTVPLSSFRRWMSTLRDGVAALLDDPARREPLGSFGRRAGGQRALLGGAGRYLPAGHRPGKSGKPQGVGALAGAERDVTVGG